MKKPGPISRLGQLVLVAVYASASVPLIAQTFSPAATGGPAVLGVSSAAAYTGVMQGFQDPYYAYIFNTAPTGSAALNYTVYANFPYGYSPIQYTGTKTADGGTTYSTAIFNFDTSQVTPGTYGITATATNNVSQGTATTTATNVTVYAHPKPAFVIGGNIVYLNQTSDTKLRTTTVPPPPVDSGAPDMTNASLPPQEAGTEGPAGGFAPDMIGDPPANIPSAELDLDSVTYSGDTEIVYDGPVTFEDLPATDDPTQNVLPFDIDLYTANVGVTYSTTFTFNYSDEQDIPGADAPGSEQASFTVDGTLNADGSVSWDVITTPEPSSTALSLLALTFLLGLGWSRTRNQRS